MTQSPHAEPEILHVLKNQLSVIVGFAELLITDQGSDEQRRKDLEEILTAGNRALSLMPSLADQLQPIRDTDESPRLTR